MVVSSAGLPLLNCAKAQPAVEAYFTESPVKQERLREFHDGLLRFANRESR